MKSSLVLFLVVLASSVVAQTPTIQQQIVVTASGLPETVESTPAAVTVVKKEEIEQLALRDVADALRTVPGLTVIRGGSSGKVTTLFTRGSNSTHTLVLWNGTEANNPFFSGYDWGRFSTAGVERIEVVRGPYSALYGSEAVAGVVNVLTAAPAKNQLEISGQVGENGLLDGTVRATFASGSWSGDLTVDHRDDDGFAPNDDLEQDTAIVQTGWTAGGFSASLSGRFMTYELGIPFSVNSAGTAFEPRLERREGGDELQIVLPVRYSRGPWHHELTFSRNENQLDFRDPEDPFGRTDATTETDSNRALFTSRVSTSIGTFVGGAEYERSSVLDVSSYGVNVDDRTRTSRSAFLEDRLSLPAGGSATFEITAGVRYDDFDTFGSEISPRVAGALVQGRNKFRAAYGRAFRAPSIGELYIPFFGNADLEAERSTSAEAGFDRYFASGAELNVTLFRSDFENLIVYDNVSQVFQNIGEAESRGGEIGFRLPVGRAATAGLTYTRLHTEATATGEALLRRPKNSGSAWVSLRTGNLTTTAVVLHSGRRADVTDLFPFGRVSSEPYTIADLKLEYDAGLFRPFVKIENLADTDYQEVFGYPSPGRRAIAGFRWVGAR